MVEMGVMLAMAALAAVLTACGPTNTPKRADMITFTSQTLQVEDLSIVYSRSGYIGWLARGTAQAHLPAWSAVYAARECLAGREMSAPAFRSFAEELVTSNAFDRVAGEVLQQVLAKVQEPRLSSCLSMYAYPTGAAEVQLAAYLVLPPLGLNFAGEWLIRDAARWLLPEVAAGEPFVVWFKDRVSPQP